MRSAAQGPGNQLGTGPSCSAWSPWLVPQQSGGCRAGSWPESEASPEIAPLQPPLLASGTVHWLQGCSPHPHHCLADLGERARPGLAQPRGGSAVLGQEAAWSQARRDQRGPLTSNLSPRMLRAGPLCTLCPRPGMGSREGPVSILSVPV